jgi:hypothetical protein
VTTIDRYPKDNLFITVLSNNESESHWIAYGLAGIVFGKNVERPYVHVEKAINRESLLKYIRKYGNLQFIENDGKLYLKAPKTELVPESDTKFFRKDNHDRTFEFPPAKKSEKHFMIMTKGGVKDTLTRHDNLH